MNTCSALEVQNNILKLIDKTNKTHEPICLKSENSEAVLLPKVDYQKLIASVELDENGWIKGTFDFDPKDKDIFPTVEEIRKNFGG
jgi:hypothetical protein